ncbi:MAG: hypothetical protein IT204_15330 [Fimbriimonadaceae bacterium]|nr:hypothetical protein [Fimbriimonadaceae bacterium]
MDELRDGLTEGRMPGEEGWTMAHDRLGCTVAEPQVQPARFAPEPRNPWRPQDYLQRLICWPQPALGTPEGEESFDRLLAEVAAQQPATAALLDWQRWDSAVKASRDYETFVAQVEAELAQQNRWIASENDLLAREIGELRAAAELAEAAREATVESEDVARAAVAAATAQLAAAQRLAAARCSAVGRSYDPQQPDGERLRQPAPEIAELALVPHPERRRNWLKPLSTAVSGAVLGFAVGHFAGLLPSDLSDLATCWPSLAVAWLLGGAIYLVLGGGLAEATRRVYRSHVDPVDPQPWRPATWVLWATVVAFAAWPLLANIAFEAFGLHAAQARWLAASQQLATLTAGDGEQPLPWLVFALLGSLMVGSNALVVVWTTLNEEDEALAAALGRRRASAEQAAWLARPDVQEALAAVATVRCELAAVATAEEALADLVRRRNAPLAGLEARLAAARERWREPLWRPDAATRQLLDNALDAASGAAAELHRAAADAVIRIRQRPAQRGSRQVATRRPPRPRRWGRWLLAAVGLAGVLGALLLLGAA